MVCLGCRRLFEGPLCGRCRLELRRAPDRPVPGVGAVRSAYLHAGPARSLVHHVKYRGVVAAARLLAEGMAELIPEGVVLVPVPRVTWRRLRYGVDPALELVTQLGRLGGHPVHSPLRPPVWGRARAGGFHGFAPRFHLRGPVPPSPVLLVDDVVTTGTTLAVAASLLPEVAGAITATASVGRRLTDRNPRRGLPSPAPEVTSLPGWREIEVRRDLWR